MIPFADRLNQAISEHSSYIVAGFDPVIESMPAYFLREIASLNLSPSDAVKKALVDFHSLALEEIKDKVAAVKINTAFFEQYGLPGLEAMSQIGALVHQSGLLLIADAKRGDIGSTAKAYSSAFLGSANAFSGTFCLLDADALTVNPFLGFDTVEVFLQDCEKTSKGIFLLVKTSNPGSAAIQDQKVASGESISEVIANWIAKNSSSLTGKCGLSGLGAVIGATYPEQAAQLRTIMKNNFFLIPGYGAQGGSVNDILPGFIQKTNTKPASAGIINISRALFSNYSNDISNTNELRLVMRSRLDKFNGDINSHLL